MLIRCHFGSRDTMKTRMKRGIEAYCLEMKVFGDNFCLFLGKNSVIYLGTREEIYGLEQSMK